MTYNPNALSNTRSRVVPPDAVDVAIVGCGLGGLLAGVLLAQSGLRVAAFDGHYVAGGCATQFRRRTEVGQFNFDVGVHYLGDCGPGGLIPTLLAAGGVECPMVPMDADGFDTLVLPGLTFKVPVGHDRYEARLLEFFPGEHRGIRKYMRFLREVDHIGRFTMARGDRVGLRAGLEVLLRGRSLVRHTQTTIKDVLDGCTQVPELRAVLLGQHGDYGLPPSQVSALLHAGLVNHYLAGAFYPEGGGQVMADKLALRLEGLGGSVHLRRPVERVLVEGGRAVGVRVAGSHGQPAREVRAKAVLSNADLKRTWLELLGTEHLSEAQQAEARGWQMGGALFMCCLGVQGDLRDLGLSASNWWVFESADIEAAYAHPLVDGRPAVRGIYATSASLKDPGNDGHAPPGHQTLEVMSLVPWQPTAWGAPDDTEAGVAAWAYKHSPRYREVKATVEAEVMALAERTFPGLGARVVYRESATPLSHTRFTGATAGTGYGLASTPGQFMQRRPGYRGPIEGLFQCGASTRAGHGIVGSLRGGQAAAFRVARSLGV